MTPTEIKLIKDIGKDVRKLLQVMGQKETEWLTSEEIKSQYKLSKKFLQLKRKDGTLKKYRCLESGKKFQYQRSEIEKLFTSIPS